MKGITIMNRPKLKVIQGGLEDKRRIGDVLIIASPDDKPPFEPDAIVREEDTFLIMSPPREDMKVVKDNLTRLMTKLIESKPLPPGTIKVKDGFPVKIIAIVYDVNQDPIWKPEWVENALIRIFEECETRRLKNLSMPMLATVFGKMPIEYFIKILTNVLVDTGPRYPKRLWLKVPYGTSKRITRIIDGKLEY